VRVLLVQNMPYVGGGGGAIRSNRIMLEQLAARGHHCRVVAPAAGSACGEYDLAGVHGLAVPSGGHLVRAVPQVIAEARPDWMLVPSDDPGGLALGVAFAACPDRVVYLTHTMQQLPFGPRAYYPSAARTRLLRRAAGVVAVSRTAQAHLARWGGIAADVLYPHVYGTGPFREHAGTAVTMVNPCGVKGISVFLGLADAFARVPFLAVASWGTTAADRRALASRPNVEVMEPVDDIDLVLARTRLLLMPSLWDETFGYTAVEAMLRGVPVLASAVGGLPEATLGAAKLLPVRRIERYDTRTDPARPIPIVPPQDLAPWIGEVRRLIGDEGARLRLGREGRAAAAAFVARLDEGALADYLARLATV
jgi:hypothetical protein